MCRNYHRVGSSSLSKDGELGGGAPERENAPDLLRARRCLPFYNEAE